MKTTLFVALALACASLTALAPAPRPDVASLMAEIKAVKDEVDPAKVTELGNLRSRAALDGLIELYDSVFGSIYLQREVVKALGLLDGVADAEQPAFQKLTDIATGSKEPELRAMALDVLGQSRGMGKHFLKTIIESTADSDVREQAMQKLVRMSDASDKDFFQTLFNAIYAEKDKEKEKKSKKDAGPIQKMTSLKAIREAAFEQIAQDEKLFDNAKLAELAREKLPADATVDREQKSGIRRLALIELERRGDKKIAELAQTVYEDTSERSPIRIEAARILMEGSKGAPDMLVKFIEDGREPGASSSTINDFESLRLAMADLVAKHRDEKSTKKLVGMVGKGKPHEQRFVLRALAGAQDEKLAKSLSKAVLDAAKTTPSKLDSAEYLTERSVTMSMITALAAMGEKSVLPDFEELIEDSQQAKSNADQTVIAAVLDATSKLRGKEAAWLDALAKYAKSSKLEVRNAALMQLGAVGDAKHLEVLTTAFDDADWSTRYAALVGLEGLRSKEAVGAIVKRLDKEEGLMLNRCAEALFRLTGKPFRTSAPAWSTWWEKEGAGFTPISTADLAKLQSDDEMRRLKQVDETSAKFFGIRIVSRRVLFIIDVSGSMAWDLHSEQAPGDPKQTRMEIAKRELLACIDALDPKSLFNVQVFSSDVDRWLDGGIAAYSKSNKTEAKAYVEKLAPAGGTNIYGALKDAFTDPDVDTIFFLSDGEPSVGEVTDQASIRERVREWNEHRRIVIHSIAVGGSFNILEWLALDSGGTHKKFQ